MKRFLFASSLIVALLMAASCGNNKGNRAEHKGDEVVKKIISVPDTTLRVALDDIVGDSIKVTAMDTDKKYSLSLGKAQNEGNILGSLTRNDHYALIANRATKEASLVVNVSEMCGQWFYDMQQHRGLKIDENGAVSPINTENISFRDWKIHNGHVIIYYVDMQQVAESKDDYHAEESQILKLSKDHMELRFGDKVLTCERQREVIKLKF